MSSFAPSEGFARGFDAAFDRPDLESEAGFDLWADLELTSDWLAGPMYNVLTDGNHDYVYGDPDGRFPGVTDAASFREWALDLGWEYLAGVAKFEPVSDAERSDKDVLVAKGNAMLALVDLAETEIASNRGGAA